MATTSALVQLFAERLYETVAGFFAFLVLWCAGISIFDFDIFNYIGAHADSGVRPFAVILGSFVLGHLLDKIAFVVFEQHLLANRFRQRDATFHLPPAVRERLRAKGLGELIADDMNAESVDRMRLDWISALFMSCCTAEQLTRWRDFVANFQFMSNMVLVSVIAVPVVPIYVYQQSHSMIATVVAPLVIAAIGGTYLALALTYVRRINTYENFAVFGYLLTQGLTEAEDGSTSTAVAAPHDAPASDPSLVAKATEIGFIPTGETSPGGTARARRRMRYKGV